MSLSSLMPMELEARFRDALAEWQTTVRPRDAGVDRFGSTRAEAQDLKARGLWTSGPDDLLSILGRQRDELFHSRILAWLLTPTGRHGFGDGFVSKFLNMVWPQERLFAGGSVAVALECSAAGTNAVTGEPVESRADVVLRMDALVVVIENKVDAGEQPLQCERLYWCWASEPVEVRWLFLTPDGRQPGTAMSDEAKSAWATLSYVDVSRAISELLRTPIPLPNDVGRSAVLQYLATLRQFHG
jgi:hypothetical protein